MKTNLILEENISFDSHKTLQQVSKILNISMAILVDTVALDILYIWPIPEYFFIPHLEGGGVMACKI